MSLEFRYILSFILLLLSSLYFFHLDSQDIVKAEHCGIIVYKTEKPYHSKRTSSILNIFYIKLKNGKEIQKRVDIRDYEIKKVGEEYCFKEYKNYGIIASFSLTLSLAILIFGWLRVSIEKGK